MQRNPNWLTRQWRRRPKPLWVVVALHVLALGVALILYVLPHHVIPRQGVAVGITSSRSDMRPSEEAQTVMAQATPEPTAEPVAATEVPALSEPVGSFRLKFADKFSETVSITENTYIGPNVNVSFSSSRYGSADYHVADVYIADITCLRSAFAKETYGSGYAEQPVTIAKRYGSVACINGDYYGARDGGVVIRNGTLYRNDRNINDMCVIYWDGTMKTFEPHEFDAETEMANGAYQAWCFGPKLLQNGETMDDFNSDVVRSNPRSAIGYFEPGHYCLVMVEGRSNTSSGLTMTELSQLMKDLGCTVAYNLDGGKSSELVKGTVVVGNPYDGGRSVSDVIMVIDSVVEESA